MEQGTQEHKVETLNRTNIAIDHFCGYTHAGVRNGKRTPKETLFYYLYDCMDSYVHKQAGVICLSSYHVGT